MMIVKVHQSDGGLILAVCDANVIGKKFETEKLQLDLTGAFYAGETKTENEILEMIKSAYMVNAVGKESVEFLKKNNLVEESRIIMIQDVPHAQVVIVRN